MAMSLMSFLPRFVKYEQGNLRQISVLRALWQNETEVSNKNEIIEADNSPGTDDPKDRSQIIDVDTSIRYMNSKAYQQTYGNNPVWKTYARNKTSHFLRDTRKTCIRGKKITTGSPCPICRDIYLVFDHRNLALLKQFISPTTGDVLPTLETGICQKQHKNLIIAYLRAREYGLISFHVPFRKYSYENYCENLHSS